MKRLVLTLLSLLSSICIAQPPPSASRQWHTTHRDQILREFTSLLSIPNVASDTVNIQRNADALIAMLKKRGVEAQLFTMPNVSPVVFGEIKTPAARHTIVFYAHYDGQPVTPSEWEAGAPFTPVMRKVNGEDYLFARSA